MSSVLQITQVEITHTDTDTQTHKETHTNTHRYTHTDTQRNTHKHTQRNTHKHTQAERDQERKGGVQRDRQKPNCITYKALILRIFVIL